MAIESKFEILPIELLQEYCKQFDGSVIQKFDRLVDSDLSIDTFSFYTSVSAVFSSKIEGEDIEVDSYIKHKRFGISFLPDYTQKIDDLYSAYQFASTSKCNRQNIEKVHEILTAHILPKNRQGQIRNSAMFVTTSNGKIEYVTAAPNQVKTELVKFYNDLDALVTATLTFQETFFFASLLHLVVVKIHPGDDGNGRTSRLIEKWFLVEKLGVKAWWVQSEKNYYAQHQTYYNNIRLLGLEYDTLDYSKTLPFLRMLQESVSMSS